MPSQTQLLLQSRKSGNVQLVDRGIRRRITRGSARRGHSKSPDEGDFERISEDYLDDFVKRNIINHKTARDAVEILESLEGLGNFFDGVGRQNFADFLFNKYVDDNINSLQMNEITLSSGTIILGYRVNSQIYLRNTKAGLRAYKFKNNTFAKMPKLR